MGWDLEWQFDHKTMSVSTPAEAMVAQIDSFFEQNRTKKQDHLILLAHDQVYKKARSLFNCGSFFTYLKKKKITNLYGLPLILAQPAQAIRLK